MYAPVQLLSASRQNLLRLTLIRVLVLAAQAGSVGMAYAIHLLPLPWLALCVTLAVSAALCLATALRLRGPWPVTEQEYAAHLGVDLIIHSVLLYYTGGSTNPFVSYYLVPLTIAAATLPWLYSIVLSGLALAAYTLLLAWYDPLDLPPGYRATLQIYGMWLSFVLAAGLITFFVARMAEELRRQEQRQAQRREESMRDQQLLAVATQAAGAAHELGTPLATMKRAAQGATPGAPRPAAAGRPRPAAGAGAAVQGEPAATGARRRGRPPPGDPRADRAGMGRGGAAALAPDATRGDLPLPEPRPRQRATLMPPADLSQALLNLLNNATDASPENLDIRLDWDAQWVKLTIRDHGPGVPLAIAEQIGRPFFTTKGKGFGLGLFLSQASVTRAGGTVKLYNHEDGGTLTELRLPHGVARP